MPAYRYYSEKKLSTGEAVHLVEQEFHHFSRVMRGGVGDLIELVDGKGSLAYATVTKKSRRDATALIDKVISEDRVEGQLIIAQAVPKMNRIEFILEKCTELGMTELWLFPSELSERNKMTPSQITRMHNILVSAMKQCGRLFLPKLVWMPQFSDWNLPTDLDMYFGDVDPTAEPLLRVLQNKKLSNNIIFFIGPESGFVENEVVALRKLGVRGVNLHKNILRTDTAPMVALSIIHACYAADAPSFHSKK